MTFNKKGTVEPSWKEDPLVNDAPWMKLVDAEEGQSEIPGSKDNPRIVEYHQATSLHASDDETPWCSAFANWIMKKAGIKGTDSAAALSWLKWGVKLDKPRFGCVVVFNHGGGRGHVTFFVKEEGGLLYCKGGNQSDKVKVSAYGKGELAGYRWPTGTVPAGEPAKEPSGVTPQKVSPLYNASQPGRGVPKASFVDELFSIFQKMPDSAFEVNDKHDIYSVISGKLGPFRGIAHRKAAAFDAMVSLAGCESSWNWNEGRDMSASNTSPETEESGAWQTSFNARVFDPRAAALVHGMSGKEYISRAKSDHEFAAKFTWYVLRGTTKHHGPVLRGEILPALSTVRVATLEKLFKSGA